MDQFWKIIFNSTHSSQEIQNTLIKDKLQQCANTQNGKFKKKVQQQINKLLSCTVGCAILWHVLIV